MNAVQAAIKRFKREHRKRMVIGAGEPERVFVTESGAPRPVPGATDEVVNIRHFGMNSRSGNILAAPGGGADVIVVEVCPEGEQASRSQRAMEGLGAPFRALPGNRPPDQIVGTLQGGYRVPAHAVEMVFNDAALIDSICQSPGKYETLASSTEVKVLRLARRLYGEESPIVQ